MKITVHERPDVRETEVTILCKKVDEQVSQVFSLLSGLGKKIVGARDGRYYPVEASAILYVDTVDRRTFLYTEAEVLECAMKLYELEAALEGARFLRAGKSLIVNLEKIHSLEPTLGGRIEAVMQNGERVVFSRQYSALLKEKIDLR